MKFTPRSNARSRISKLSASFVSHEKFAEPSAIGLIIRPVRPSLRYFMSAPEEVVGCERPAFLNKSTHGARHLPLNVRRRPFG